ncbi:MAG: acyl-homoserine-lactone synthase [Paracoccaceae bacterium]
MLRYVSGAELRRHDKLFRTMFRDRAAQFRDRLNWAVRVDGDGYERDEYDDAGPLYVVWEKEDGSHGGSMRFLPTAGGPTMVNDHFARLIPEGRIADPRIWECTRFCLAPDAGPKVSAALMLGGAEVGLRFGLTHAVGVFDDRMVRIYRLLGWSPDIVAREGAGKDAVGLGFWAFSGAIRDVMARRAGLSREASALWFLRSAAVGAAAA